MLKILITGPESSGKTTLTKAAAFHFNCLWVQEYARAYLNQLDRAYTKEDLDHILLGQIEQLTSKKIAANDAPFLFCDTGPEVIYIWSQYKYGHVSTLIKQHTVEHHYDLRFICYPGLAWEEDELREAPNFSDRLQLFNQYCQLHEVNNWPFIIIKGKKSERLNRLIEHVNNLVKNQK